MQFTNATSTYTSLLMNTTEFAVGFFHHHYYWLLDSSDGSIIVRCLYCGYSDIPFLQTPCQERHLTFEVSTERAGSFSLCTRPPTHICYRKMFEENPAFTSALQPCYISIAFNQTVARIMAETAEYHIDTHAHALQSTMMDSIRNFTNSCDHLMQHQTPYGMVRASATILIHPCSVW